jgi:hypothetical protein
MRRELIEKLLENFSGPNLDDFFRSISDYFYAEREDLSAFIPPGNEIGHFRAIQKIGEMRFPSEERVVVAVVNYGRELTSRTGKRRQFELARKVLKDRFYDAGIFIFSDGEGHFRFSFVKVNYLGPRREYSSYKRYTFYVSKEQTNKTFISQMLKANFSSIEKTLTTFSIDAVSDDFYKEFSPKFLQLAQSVQSDNTVAMDIKYDFALLFVIRIIFLGFVQKKGWVGQNERFLQDFLREYQASEDPADSFYRRWLKPLFFEALNQPPGKKVAYGNNSFSPKTEETLQMAPFLNGELFSPVRGLDDMGYYIPDSEIEAFFEFLFQYNFTIDENTISDEELELNPEFLGIIFERLVNQEDGAVYTPRTEVDFMCRIALVKWLEKNTQIDKRDLYRFLFRELGSDSEYDQDQHHGDFSTNDIREIHQLLSGVTVCDPAAGSGAFEVGMLHVLYEALENLEGRPNAPDEIKGRMTSFERKREIIANSLYGVEVKKWAVWINQLRLWLTLFIDMTDDLKMSMEPLLPSLGFKVRCGDSLVQRIGGKTFPVRGHAEIGESAKRKLKQLQKYKHDFFLNRGKSYNFVRHEEYLVFKSILDEEIKQKENSLRQLRENLLLKKNQGSLYFINEQTTSEKRVQGQFQGQIEKIEKEIADLKSEKQQLAEEHPLVWNIEFAEIFYEKGGFDIVIGNPPYVRQTQIDDPLGKTQGGTAYKNLLKEMVCLDFPEYFGTGRLISGRSDLYTYFFIRSLRILNSSGVHVFICSNSWLDVNFGAWLQEFLLRNVPLYFIFDNQAKRSFANADINTVITVMGAPTKINIENDRMVKFVTVRKPFQEAVFSENLLAIEECYQRRSNEMLRVVPKTVAELLDEGKAPTEGMDRGFSSIYVGNKWGGKYLRAPDIFFKILERGEGKLEKLIKFAEVNEGRPTGANDFFFIPFNVVDEFQIENRYLLPGLMKTRGKAYLRLTKDKVDRCFLALERNKRWEKANVSEYIKYGEKEILPKSRTLKAKKDWWCFPDRKPADLLAPCGYGETVWCGINSARAITSNSYTEIRLHSYDNLASVFFTLNHPIGWLFLELVGRSSLGGGMLKVDPIEYRQVLITHVDQKLFVPFDRQVQSIFAECGINPESGTPIEEQEPHPLPDRAALDKVVFDALELTEEERKDVYRAVCRLVWNRISRARSV